MVGTAVIALAFAVASSPTDLGNMSLVVLEPGHDRHSIEVVATSARLSVSDVNACIHHASTDRKGPAIRDRPG